MSDYEIQLFTLVIGFNILYDDNRIFILVVGLFIVINLFDYYFFQMYRISLLNNSCEYKFQ